MDFILGIITGFISGFGLLYIQYHKSEISYSIAVIKEDVSALSVKIDRLISQLSPK